MKYSVLVKPGGSRNLVEKTEDGSLIVRTHAKAHDGEANKAVVELLADYFGVSKSMVKVVRGEKSRQKIVEIE